MLNRLVRYDTVQEMANPNWATADAAVLASHSGVGSPATARFRFTGFSTLAAVNPHFHGTALSAGPYRFHDCQFYGGALHNDRPGLHLTNCLLHRVAFAAGDGNGAYDLSVRNNLHYGGAVGLGHYEANDWNFSDTLFHAVTHTFEGFYNTVADYNAYYTNAPGQWLDTLGAHDQFTATAVAFQTGPLGRFYLPGGLSLLNAGSTSATNVGLYHFTTATNQVKETNSTVDISGQLR